MLANVYLWLDKKRKIKYGYQLKDIAGCLEHNNERVSQEIYWHEIEQAQKLFSDNDWVCISLLD